MKNDREYAMADCSALVTAIRALGIDVWCVGTADPDQCRIIGGDSHDDQPWPWPAARAILAFTLQSALDNSGWLEVEA